MENFEQLCQQRRSIRKYSDQPIEQDKIDYILRCALMSPSGKRINPWEFYVISDVEKVRSLSEAKEAGNTMWSTAQTAIVVALDESKSDTWMADGAIAAQHIMLAAADQGLGSCWCQICGRDAAEDYVRQLCGITLPMRILCVISLGYKDEDRRPYDPAKLLYDKIHYVK